MKQLLTKLGVGIMIMIVSFVVFNMGDISLAGPIAGVGRKDVVDRLNQDPDKVIDVSSIKWNPISNGSDVLVGKSDVTIGEVEGIYKIETDSYDKVLTTTMEKITNVVNVALWFLALIALIYLIIQGIRMLLNPDDDKVQTQALEAIKTVAWVLVGIWLTWFIITAVFFVISLFTE